MSDGFSGLPARTGTRSHLQRTPRIQNRKGICAALLETAKSGAVPPDLSTVARNFIELQRHREIADYDNDTHWSRSDVEHVLTLATDGFDA